MASEVSDVISFLQMTGLWKDRRDIRTLHTFWIDERFGYQKCNNYARRTRFSGRVGQSAASRLPRSVDQVVLVQTLVNHNLHLDCGTTCLARLGGYARKDFGMVWCKKVALDFVAAKGMIEVQ